MGGGVSEVMEEVWDVNDTPVSATWTWDASNPGWWKASLVFKHGWVESFWVNGQEPAAPLYPPGIPIHMMPSCRKKRIQASFDGAPATKKLKTGGSVAWLWELGLVDVRGRPSSERLGKSLVSCVCFVWACFVFQPRRTPHLQMMANLMRVMKLSHPPGSFS